MIHGGNYAIDPPIITRVVVDVELPLHALLSQNRPHNPIHPINEHQARLLGLRFSSSMIDVEEDRVVVGFATGVEAAGRVLVEEDVNPERGKSQVGIELGYFFGDLVLVVARDGAGGIVDGPAEHFEMIVFVIE